MIKVEVGGGKKGPHEAEWLIHEKLLLANSELAKGCLAHDTTETSTDTIKMEEAGAEAFGVFVNYLYKERLESAKLDVDQLITVYLLADYVACPKFADLVFQQIHIRTHNATFTYSAIQIDHILSNTLAVHPLRTLLLDQVGRGILQKKYDFSASTEDGQLLEPHMVELMGAVVQAVKTTNICFSSPLFQSSIYPDIRHYLKHDPTSVEAETSETPSPAVTSKIDADEAEIGRHAVDYVVRESGVTRSKALNALKTNGFKPGQAIRSLKR